MPPPRADRPRRANPGAAWGIPVVYAVAVLARSSIIIVIPTLAYRNLGEASVVSAVYLVASLCGLLASLSLPTVLQSLGPWRLLIGASLIGTMAAVLFCIPGPLTLIGGLALHFLMIQLFETVTNVYALNAISRAELARFEPRRIMFAGTAYIAGPFIGAFLLAFGPLWSPFAFSAVCALVVPLILLGLLPDARRPPTAQIAEVKGPLAVRRFLAQPRLRLAWVLAIARAGWWQMFFVYTPILAAAGGISVAHAGSIAGAASALLLLAPLWGMLMRAVGMRRFLFAAYAACGVATAIAGFASMWSFGAAAVALILAALAISGVDSAGNAPFMRAVRKRERLGMVPIYNTYREMAQIVPAAVYAVLLTMFGVSSVFVVSGLALGLLSVLCMKLPRRA